jgi:hypothetical protein
MDFGRILDEVEIWKFGNLEISEIAKKYKNEKKIR